MPLQPSWYITEKTYLQWIKRFLEYVKQTGEKETSAKLEPSDCKNFLSHLALKEKEWAWQYVFPANNLSVDPRSGKVRRHHISDTAIQDVIKKAIRKAGIPKFATVHTLRHSFATHLLMNGVNIGKAPFSP